MGNREWFRRWALIGYVPITRSGWITVLLMVTGFIAFLTASIVTSDILFATTFGWLAFFVAVIGHLVVFYHMKW